MLLRHHLEQELTKTAIAEKLGVSRRTVCHWIGTSQLDRDLDAEPVRYAPRTPVPWKLISGKFLVRVTPELHRRATDELNLLRRLREKLGLYEKARVDNACAASSSPTRSPKTCGWRVVAFRTSIGGRDPRALWNDTVVVTVP